MLNSNNNNINSKFIIYSGCQYHRKFFLPMFIGSKYFNWDLYYTFAVQLYYIYKESKQPVVQQFFLFIIISNYK
jgi:hypothetical protein